MKQILMDMLQCRATTKSGKRCSFRSRSGVLCRIHHKKAIRYLKADAIRAEEVFSIDELERYASQQKQR